MGESARRRNIERELLPFIVSGQLGIPADLPADPSVAARSISSDHRINGIVTRLRSGERVTYVLPSPSAPDGFDFSGGTQGLGASLLSTVRRCISSPAVRENIYAMPYEDVEQMLEDHRWFSENGSRWLRIRPLSAVERRIGEVRDGWVDRIVVITTAREAGVRYRFAYGCPVGDPDAREDRQDREIAELVLRYARFDQLQAAS